MNLRVTAGALAAALAFIPGQSFAGPRDDVLEAMGKCAALADGKARLACYDAVAPRLKDALATPPPSLGRTPTAEEQKSWFGFDISGLFGGGSTEPTKPEEFGKERTVEAQQAREQAQATGQVIDSITANVTDVAFTPFGQFIVFLDNGQVWRQLQGDSDRAHFKSSARENRVTVSKGFIGSYNMTINDSDKLYKVTRVK
jgi:hypothetical protein